MATPVRRSPARCPTRVAGQNQPASYPVAAGQVASVVGAAALLAPAPRWVVLTGAGISTDSGIPDYRGPQGLWTRDPAAAARPPGLAEYRADPDRRRRAWQQRCGHPVWQARPNAGHRALVTLEQAGRLAALVTQNVDGLHQAAGSSEDVLLELHGTLHRARCLDCQQRSPMSAQLARVRAGESDPACRECGGMLTSDTVAFGERLPPAVLLAAEQAVDEAAALLVVGTSLAVAPASGLVPRAVRAGALTVIINAEPTRFDSLAAAVVRAPIGAALPELVRRVA